MRTLAGMIRRVASCHVSTGTTRIGPNMNDNSLILTEVTQQVATLTLNRPKASNALSAAMMADLAWALADLDDRDDVRAIVMRGAGSGFCAGADLNELAQQDTARVSDVEGPLSEVLARLEHMSKPTVASLHGYALGGGFLLSIYCDFRIAAAGTQIGFPSSAAHWLPAAGLARIADWVGPLRAQQLVLAPGGIPVEKAQSLGLVDDVVSGEELSAATNALTARLREASPVMVAEARRIFRDLLGHRGDPWDRAAATGFARCLVTSEAQAALRAFTEARRNGK